MTETPWFHDRHVDEPDEYDTVLPLPFWAALLAALFVMLPGCATTARDAEVCYVKRMGDTEEGLMVILQQCLSVEAFQAGQK